VILILSVFPPDPTGLAWGSQDGRCAACHRLAAWSMHQAKAYLLDHRHAIDPSGMYHDWAIGDPL